MTTIYRVINRSDNKIKQYRNPHDVAVFFLGRLLRNYMVIKSDDQGDRLFVLDSGDFNDIESGLKLL